MAQVKTSHDSGLTVFGSDRVRPAWIPIVKTCYLRPRLQIHLPTTAGCLKCYPPTSNCLQIGIPCLLILACRNPFKSSYRSLTQSHFDSTLDFPIHNLAAAQIIISAISADKPVKSPLLVRRSIQLIPSAATNDEAPVTIKIQLGALTARQARVSMDHLINDLDLVLETLETFAQPA